MRTSLWILNIIVVTVLAFFLGYALSSKTGVEPGFFEAGETGSYGGGGGAAAPTEGISEEEQKYYEELAK